MFGKMKIPVERMKKDGVENENEGEKEGIKQNGRTSGFELKFNLQCL